MKLIPRRRAHRRIPVPSAALAVLAPGPGSGPVPRALAGAPAAVYSDDPRSKFLRQPAHLAALGEDLANVLEGKGIGRCMQRHRHQEFIRFLNTIETDIPAGKIIHVVLDNYATHKHPGCAPGSIVTPA